MKLTEDEIILILIEHLKKSGWNIESHCLGQTRGCDIIAIKNKHFLIVEAKGARAGDKSPTKKRVCFDRGQIKTHFGKAIVKMLEQKHLNPQANVAIAHPDDPYIKSTIGHLLPFINAMGIKHYWVGATGIVIEN
jgi:hypothetical protein